MSRADRSCAGGLKLLCSPTGRDGSLIITSDTDISSAILRKGERVSLQPKPDRAYWIQVLRGGVLLNGDKRLLAGDGHGMYHERQLEIVSLGKGERPLRAAGEAALTRAGTQTPRPWPPPATSGAPTLPRAAATPRPSCCCSTWSTSRPPWAARPAACSAERPLLAWHRLG